MEKSTIEWKSRLFHWKNRLYNGKVGSIMRKVDFSIGKFDPRVEKSTFPLKKSTPQWKSRLFQWKSRLDKGKVDFSIEKVDSPIKSQLFHWKSRLFQLQKSPFLIGKVDPRVEKSTFPTFPMEKSTLEWKHQLFQ